MHLASTCLCFFFVNGPATPDVYTHLHTLSLHDALPIYIVGDRLQPIPPRGAVGFADQQRRADLDDDSPRVGEQRRHTRLMTQILELARHTDLEIGRAHV